MGRFANTDLLLCPCIPRFSSFLAGESPLSKPFFSLKGAGFRSNVGTNPTDFNMIPTLFNLDLNFVIRSNSRRENREICAILGGKCVK